ncbi:MAG: peptidylprolyl isomerase, partial [Thermoguttaceae bacterium]
GTGSLTGSGSVTSATQQITGVNVSSLKDGTLTFSVTLTDEAENVGTAATAMATLDTVAPSGYTIAADQTLINATQATATGFTFADAATGTTYQYAITSSGGTGSVSGSGSVTSTTQDITGINVTSLPDGTLTYSVILTNSAGNPGAAATAAATLDTAAPSGYTIIAVPAALNATAATNAGLTFAGAEVGTTYNYSITSSGGGSPITGSGSVTSATQSISGINVTSLSDGSLTYSVTLTDFAGNVGTAATASGVLERVAPSGYSIQANQAVVNNATSTNAGFTFSDAEVNATYNFTVTSSGGGSPVTGSGNVTSATEQVTGVDVSSLSNGTLTYSITLTDQAGNVGAAVTATATLDILTVTSTPATSATVGQVYSYTVTTNASSGDTVTVAAESGTTLPAGIQLMGQTLTWTPTTDQAGTSPSFTLTVTDTTTDSSTTVGPVFVEVASASGLTVLAPPATVAIGSPELIAFDSANSGTPNFSVTTSDSSALTATLMPQTNQVLKIVTSLGEMDFQLLNNYTPNTVAQIVDLVKSDTYTTSSFYRVIQNFMIQGGVGSSYTGTPISTIPDELNPDLRFTTSGLLTMANNGADGNSSEFFVTGPDDTGTTNTNFSDGFLDFRYTIFGKLIAGDNVRQAIAATPVENNGATPPEDSQPVTPVTIESMSVTTETNAGVLLLSALPGATGSYTVTVSDGLGGTQTFTVNVGTDPYSQSNPWVQPINGTDTISTAYNTAVTFTPQGKSADGSAVQVNAQLFLPIVSYPTALVDNSYNGSYGAADATNPDMTLTQNGSSYTVTPNSGFSGVQVLEVTAVVPISGTFELQVGSVTTGSINFDSTDLATTAANMQTALQSAGFSGATVSAVSPLTSPSLTDFSFNVTFAKSESPITYVAGSTALPVTFTNSVTAAASAQTLTFDESSPGTSWDSNSKVDPFYRAFVPVFVAPPTPQIDSISVNGQTVTGSTSANNSTTASELSFDISGAVSGATVSVYLDGGTTPIATGTVASGATTITLTTDGTTTLSIGNHTFTVEQSVATPIESLYADWYTNSSGQYTAAAEFSIPANSVNSAASAGTALSIVAPTPPSGYTIAASQPTINASQATSTGFAFTGATTGLIYNYTVTSSGGSGSVTGSGTVTSATQQVTGVDVSTLKDGTLTFSVTLTFDAGDTGAAATATATLDTAGPSGYTISADLPTINAGQATSTGFTFADATTGTTYSFTVTSSGGTASVTGSGNVTSATQDIKGIDVASLPNGVLTYSVTLTNEIGNTGAAATATATLDT